MLFLYNIYQTLLKEHSSSFKNSRSREYNYLIISIIRKSNVRRRRARKFRDFHVRGIEWC